MTLIILNGSSGLFLHPGPKRVCMVKKFIIEWGEVFTFVQRFFSETFRPHFEAREFLRQAFEMGNRSLPLVSVISFVVGIVFTMQSHPTLEKFGAQSWIPALVSVSLVREICPIFCALVCAGKISSAIAAELGSMRVTEEIDAMEVSGTNPFRYLVVTRVLSTTLMVPILVVLADVIALYSSYLGINMKNEEVNLTLFSNQVFQKLTFGDLMPSIIKSFFFGFAIGIIGCYKGYTTENGTEGVGRSANSAVVTSIFVVFILDLLAAQIADMLQLT
jgi:phospholipid/cholesterol/gamma-HCH transport system permease protein